MMSEPILVVWQRISIRDSFGNQMDASFETTFELQSIEEGEKLAEIFLRQGGWIKPLRIMKAGHGNIHKEYK